MSKEEDSEEILRLLRERVFKLEGAIDRYLQNPGCNAPSKAKAIEDLKRALDGREY